MRIAVTCFIFGVAVACAGCAALQATSLPGRPSRAEQAIQQADLVVIATAVSSRKTGEKRMFLGNQAAGVETTFNVDLLLKGKHPIETFVLVHYMEEPTPSGGHHFSYPSAHILEFETTSNMPPSGLPGGAGPINPTKYLLFLKRTGQGKYIPMNGQATARSSIFELQRMDDESVFDEPLE